MAQRKRWSVTALCASCLVVPLNLACGAESDETSGEPAGQIEIFSWWAGEESPALNALIDVYKRKYPKVAVINAAVQGGAGFNARQLLSDRMSRNEPPDAFQIHAGAELIRTWVRFNDAPDESQSKMETLDFLFDKNGFRSVVPQDLLSTITYKGHIYSVPLNVHRANVLFYNMRLFTENGLKPPATWAEFYAVAEVFKAKGIAPLALGAKESWTITHIFETVLLSNGGPSYYREFLSGDRSADDPQISAALIELKKILSYSIADAFQLSWTEAAARLTTGAAAMTIMGDWTKGYYETQTAWKADLDFGSVPSPGTSGTFVAVTDTFGLPKGAPHRTNAVAFLEVLLSPEGQNTFNPIKGSLPIRTDVHIGAYDASTQRALADFRSNILVPSLAHGSAAPPMFVNALNEDMARFLADGNMSRIHATLKSRYGQLK